MKERTCRIAVGTIVFALAFTGSLLAAIALIG